jgi:hypothetical protein
VVRYKVSDLEGPKKLIFTPEHFYPGCSSIFDLGRTVNVRLFQFELEIRTPVYGR